MDVLLDEQFSSLNLSADPSYLTPNAVSPSHSSPYERNSFTPPHASVAQLHSAFGVDVVSPAWLVSPLSSSHDWQDVAYSPHAHLGLCSCGSPNACLNNYLACNHDLSSEYYSRGYERREAVPLTDTDRSIDQWTTEDQALIQFSALSLETPVEDAPQSTTLSHSSQVWTDGGLAVPSHSDAGDDDLSCLMNRASLDGQLQMYLSMYIS